MNILYLYNSTQTYTATVFEHIFSFYKYSSHRSFFSHQDQYNKLSIDLSVFDAVVIHYTIRFPFDQISDENEVFLSDYKGLKVLFIQDEYDHPHRTWSWIKRLGIQLVFTVVPQNEVLRVYPSQEFPGVRFVNVLTGYVPENIALGSYQPPSQRQIVVGYRGRPLPIRYGDLGREKVSIGMLVANYCEKHKISYDIKWTEEARIYGPQWYEYVSSCRAMLGSESGSNVFDWDGTLSTKIEELRSSNPNATDDDIYDSLIKPLEIPGLMNQVSPRIFEAIASGTVLVLFEGDYSGVVTPGLHFIPLKKDGSNLDEVFSLLADEKYVDKMAERAYRDIIASGQYSYQSFVSLVDKEIEISIGPSKDNKTSLTSSQSAIGFLDHPTPISTSPIRAMPPPTPTDTLVNTVCGSHGLSDLAGRLAIYLWWKLPEIIRLLLKPCVKGLLRRV